MKYNNLKQDVLYDAIIKCIEYARRHAGSDTKV
jgi:hypothetical protein